MRSISHTLVYTNVHPRTSGYTPLMAQEAQELSTRDVRANLAEVINEAAVNGTITFITTRGRRIAALVPVAIGEAALADSPGSSAE